MMKGDRTGWNWRVEMKGGGTNGVESQEVRHTGGKVAMQQASQAAGQQGSETSRSKEVRIPGNREGRKEEKARKP